MRIKELTITNFRGFEGEHAFKFSDSFTVIAGINGRGKTSILDAIRFASGRLLPQISKASGQYPKITKYDVNHGVIGNGFKIGLATNCVGHPVRFQLEYNDTSNKTKPTRLPRGLAKSIRNEYGNDPSTDDDAAPLVVCYTTDRASFRLPKSLPKTIPSLDRAAFGGALVNRTVDYKDLAYRLKALQSDAIYPGDTALKMQRAISHVISSLMDGFENIRVIERPLGILVDKGGVTLELFQLSDGERSALSVAADLARRLTLANPRLDDPLQGSGVVLIDELELHLHPLWQRAIANKLRKTFPNIQFICTTHSPFVIQSVQAGELVLLDDEVTTEYADQSIEDIAENVMDVPMPQKSERYRLMVETAEKYFKAIQGLAKLSEVELTRVKKELDELAEPFSDDPAYHGMLRAERDLALGELK